MNILITGAFGNIGKLVLAQALRRGHAVSVLEMDTKRNRKAAQTRVKRAKAVFLGDIRDSRMVARAVTGQDVVLHMAGILPPASEARPDLCRAVNVGGTENLVAALRQTGRGASLVFVSSVSVMGRTQDRTPPLRASDPVHPENTYARTKTEAEAVVCRSGLRHCILRLSAVMPTSIFYTNLLSMIVEAYAMPLDLRCEIVVDIDAAAACVHAAEGLPGSGALDGKTFFIAGGGGKGCQMRAREMYRGIFGSVGIPVPREDLFVDSRTGYPLDWYDTEEAEEELHFQNHTFEDFQGILGRQVRPLRPLIRLFRPWIVEYVARKSPQWKRAARPRRFL